MQNASDEPSPVAPLVSVVIPTHNRSGILQRCLEALVIQTYPAFEVIVVDDGSTDDTPALMERLAAAYGNVSLHYLRNERHIGANPCRNQGVHAANGVLVGFLDSDCIAEPDWLEKLTQGFTSERVAAVVGLVKDPTPTNIFELAFKGTHRVTGAGQARRLVGGNMCVRRDILLSQMFDEDRAGEPNSPNDAPPVATSGRGDEEGVFLALQAAGYEQRVVPDAVVLHEHGYTARTFFRQALRGGRSAARLVYKYYLPPRMDLLPWLLTYATFPLMLIRGRLGLVALAFLLSALAAMTYNELALKGKTVGEALRSFPVLLAYYQVRLVGYVVEGIRLRLGLHRIKRTRLVLW